MLEDKKRAKSFKDLALTSIPVQWRISDKLIFYIKYQLVMVEAAGIEQFVQLLDNP
ncbi:MAG TPA: hypothetical protein VF905_08495 [Nitrospirota bacterium]